MRGHAVIEMLWCISIELEHLKVGWNSIPDFPKLIQWQWKTSLCIKTKNTQSGYMGQILRRTPDICTCICTRIPRRQGSEFYCGIIQITFILPEKPGVGCGAWWRRCQVGHSLAKSRQWICGRLQHVRPPLAAHLPFFILMTQYNESRVADVCQDQHECTPT